MVVYPINAFLAFSYGINYSLGGVVALVGFFGGRRASKTFSDYSDMFEEEQVD